MNVVLVDDSLPDRELFLHAWDAEAVAKPIAVSAVATAQELLDYIESSQPEAYPKLVVTDINMPMITGIELARTLRNNPQTRAIVTVIISTSNNHSDLKSAEDMDVPYLIKPPSFKDYPDFLREILSHYPVRTL